MKKKNRVFILAEREFPNGNAGGVRVHYMARAFQENGYEVMVLSLGCNKPDHYDEKFQGYFYDGIRYDNYFLGRGILRKIRRFITSGINAVYKLRKYTKNSKEKNIVVVYTSNAIYASFVLFFARKNNIIWMDVVEWFQKEQFKKYKVNVKYWLYQFCFNKLYPATGRVITISSLLEKKFKSLGCKTILLPSMYDTQINSELLRDDRKQEMGLSLIYSGGPGQKEKLFVMLSALRDLPADKRDRIEFHFTGVKKAVIKKLLLENWVLLDELAEHLIFHNWMKYDELIFLYQKMDFLFFIREATIFNVANFPTKLAELMSYGVVPLTTNVGDYGALLTNGVDSIIAQNSSIAECKAALNRVLELDRKEIDRLSENAKESARRKFDYRVYAGRLKNIEEL